MRLPVPHTQPCSWGPTTAQRPISPLRPSTTSPLTRRNAERRSAVSGDTLASAVGTIRPSRMCWGFTIGIPPFTYSRACRDEPKGPVMRAYRIDPICKGVQRTALALSTVREELSLDEGLTPGAERRPSTAAFNRLRLARVKPARRTSTLSATCERWLKCCSISDRMRNCSATGGTGMGSSRISRMLIRSRPTPCVPASAFLRPTGLFSQCMTNLGSTRAAGRNRMQSAFTIAGRIPAGTSQHRPTGWANAAMTRSPAATA